MKTAITVQSGEFKTHCLRYLNELTTQHKTFVITKRGKAIARLIPMEDTKPRSLYGCLKGTATIQDDIITPINEAWSADSDD